jgi:type IX secretion system PorP/SprF family membrane protein
MRGIKLITVVLSLLSIVSVAQDMHFSQFNEQPALLNPALSGATKRYRISMGYKNQWKKVSDPYKTFGVSIDGKILKGSWRAEDMSPLTHRQQDIGRIGGGLSIYRDVAGAGDMSLTQINGSLAGFIPTGHWSFLSVGLQAGMNMKRIDQTTLIFPNQFDGLGYSADVNSGEDVPLDRYRFFDFAAGALWSYGYADKGFVSSRRTSAKFGLAAYHLTQPDLRVIGRASEQLNMKFVAHGDLLLSIANSSMALNPSFLFQMQGPFMEIVVGTMVKYYTTESTKFTGVKKTTSWDFGVFYRNADAIIMQIMLEYEEQYSFGFSYDINFSSLSQSTRYRGGPEFVIRITPQDDYLFQRK